MLNRRLFAALESWLQDLRYAGRTLRLSPGFTCTAALSLALGVGAGTAIFTVANALLLKTLPVPHPEQLVMFDEKVDGKVFDGDFSYPQFAAFAQLRDVFSGVASVYTLNRSNLVIDPNGEPDQGQVTIGLVSGSYFSTLGVPAAAGRTFSAKDDVVPGRHPVAVISHAFWSRRFGRAPDTIGRTFSLNGVAYIIIGATRQGFSGDWVGSAVDVWIPLAMQGQLMLERPDLLSNPNPPWLRIIARVRPDVPLQRAQAAVQVVFPQTVRQMRNLTPRMLDEILHERIELSPASRGYSPQRETFGEPLMILLAAVGLVLAIACANVANLLLARSTTRRREIAVRLALGAHPRRIVRQLLTESLLLAVIGGAAGVMLADWGSLGLLKLAASGPIPLDLNLSPDFRVLTFAAALSILNGFIFGLAPALQAGKVSLAPVMNSRGATGLGEKRFGFRRALVVSQVAISMLLLVGAGLFVRTLRNLRSQDVGFDRRQVLLVWTAPTHIGRTGSALATLFQNVQERISRVPGVASAGVSGFGLLDDQGGGSPIKVAGHNDAPNDIQRTGWNQVSPGYFRTVGMRLMLGRDFTERDNERSPRVAIINETVARDFFGTDNPVGKHFGIRRDTGNEIEIVGVVKDAKYHGARDHDVRMVYFPYRQDLGHLGDMCIAVRAPGDAAALPARIRAELKRIDAVLPVVRIDTPEEQLDFALYQERMIASLAGLFGGFAMILACLGLYGVMSYVAARRTNEIGIRMALGAQRGQVAAMVLRESLLLAVVGIAAGIPAALLCGRVIAARLFGVAPGDPLTLGAAAALMTGVAAVAAWWPALRASQVDPVAALRCE